MLQCGFKSITFSKLGNSVDENEDNILEPSSSEIESHVIRFAISDGATESSFSKEWSDLLVSAYKDKHFEKGLLTETVKKISESWRSITTAIELPWYAQQKAENGAFATFLGLTINLEKNSFKVVAVGDCALFQIRDDKLICSFPISSIEDFHNTPNLIATNEEYQYDLENNATYQDGTILPKDIIILSTDALAAWILEHCKKGRKVWKSLVNMLFIQNEENKDSVEKWLNKLRKAKKIKNDDVTLLIIKFK